MPSGRNISAGKLCANLELYLAGRSVIAVPSVLLVNFIAGPGSSESVERKPAQ